MNNHRHMPFSKKAILVLALLLFFYWFFHGKTPPSSALPPPPVIVQKPIPIPIAEYITQTGNTVAFNAVNLVARVEGYLDAIEFVDGSFVKKNQPLFIIEPEPYLEQLKEAQASLKAKQANYEYAKTEYARQQRMYKENATSLSSVQKWQANSDESKAAVDKARANEKIAAINYSYTHILAPFNGRIGRHLVDKGNLVGNGQATDLATIEQIDPIYVYFNLNELDLIKLRKAAEANGFKPSNISQIPVGVQMQNESGFPHHGTLDFVNTSLNASTGTMQFRAILPNKQYALLPGLFVQIRIAVTKPSKQLTIPDQAIQYDQIGPYVLIVDSQHHVVLKRVTLGSLEAGRRAIIKGLQAEDEVIVNGLQNATPGHLVSPQTTASPPKSSAASPSASQQEKKRT